MRILLVNHFPLIGSGSGIYVHNIARSLVELGHQVCIIMPENTTNIPCEEGIKVHPVFFKREEVIDGQLDFNFPCMDPHPRSNLLFENMTDTQLEQYVNAFKQAIEEEIKSFKPDIIHSQHIWIITSLLKQFNVPYAITSHGAEFITYRKTRRFDKFVEDAISGCSKIITISEDNKNEILEYLPEAESKIELIKNAYNSRDFYKQELNKEDILNEFDIENYDKIVLFAGRVSQMKGLDTLFKAAKIYERENVATLIAGDGNYKTELEKMQKELGLKNIVFLGSKNQKELNRLYNVADVFVLPSRKEALPLVAIEAMACGTPVVATNQSGMANIVTKEVGLIFEMDDEVMLAKQINKIFNKEIIFDENVIMNHAKTNYSQEIFIEKLLKIYEKLKG